MTALDGVYGPEHFINDIFIRLIDRYNINNVFTFSLLHNML